MNLNKSNCNYLSGHESKWHIKIEVRTWIFIVLPFACIKGLLLGPKQISEITNVVHNQLKIWRILPPLSLSNMFSCQCFVLIPKNFLYRNGPFSWYCLWIRKFYFSTNAPSFSCCKSGCAIQDIKVKNLIISSFDTC